VRHGSQTAIVGAGVGWLNSHASGAGGSLPALDALETWEDAAARAGESDLPTVAQPDLLPPWVVRVRANAVASQQDTSAVDASATDELSRMQTNGTTMALCWLCKC